MVFMTGNLIFTDFFQFMNKSLSNLADDLPKDRFYHTKRNLAPWIKGNAFILMIIWMILINSMKKGYHQ